MRRASPSSGRQEGGFPSEAFERLAAIEPGHYWFESRNQLIIWALRRYFPEARTLLEVGCGTGFVLQGLHAAFSSLHLTASDAMSGGLVIARARVPSATFLQQDARALDAVEEFDVVCAFDVLEHITEDAHVLRRLFAAANPGGGALLTVPQHAWLWSRADEYGHHVRRYRRRDLVDRVREAGFELVRVTSFVSLLLPLMAVSRLMKSTRDGRLSDREIAPSPRMNGVLRAVLGMERRAVQLGVSWPMGGSLLVVARKKGG